MEDIKVSICLDTHLYLGLTKFLSSSKAELFINFNSSLRNPNHQSSKLQICVFNRTLSKTCSGGDSWWRVCYQRGLPRLVLCVSWKYELFKRRSRPFGWRLCYVFLNIWFLCVVIPTHIKYISVFNPIHFSQLILTAPQFL